MARKLPAKRTDSPKARRARAKFRGWLIFAGILGIFFSMSLLKFRMRVLFSKAGIPLLLMGLAILVLTLLKRREGDRR